MLIVLLPLLLLVLQAGAHTSTLQNHSHYAEEEGYKNLTCTVLGLCSLGHVKPFTGDIFDGKLCLDC